MTWIPSHQSLATHRKLLAFAKELGISRAEAIGHLHLFWWWCVDNAPTGLVRPEDVALFGPQLDLHGDVNVFFNALVSCGFVDKKAHGNAATDPVRRPTYRVHDWDRYAGKHLRELEAERQRSRDRRSTGKRPPDDQRTDRRSTEKRPAAEESRGEESRSTTTTPYSPPNSANDELFTSFYQAYESTFQQPVPHNVTTGIEGLIDDGDVPPEWWETACRSAYEQGKSSWAYLKAIIGRYRLEGFHPSVGQKGGRPRRQPAFPPAYEDDPEYWHRAAKEAEEHMEFLRREQEAREAEATA